jgi:hypothetical protein
LIRRALQNAWSARSVFAPADPSISPGENPARSSAACNTTVFDTGADDSACARDAVVEGTGRPCCAITSDVAAIAMATGRGAREPHPRATPAGAAMAATAA